MACHEHAAIRYVSDEIEETRRSFMMKSKRTGDGEWSGGKSDWAFGIGNRYTSYITSQESCLVSIGIVHHAVGEEFISASIPGHRSGANVTNAL